MKHPARPPVDFARAKLLVMAGSGGVGKTTTAAAVALAAAASGRRVLVLTIDPARRLLQALGLHSDDPNAILPLPNTAHEVLPRLADQMPMDCVPGGTLHAMMLDPTTGAIAMVERLLPDQAMREQVLNNRIYRAFLPTLQASPDYMALELIYEMCSDPRFDLLVLDTPPMHNALDFLRSGNTLASFINDRVLKWFSKVPLPGKKVGGLAGLFGTGSSMAMGVLGRLFGSETLPDVAEFFVAFQAVLPRLRDRALATDAMLRADTTHFLIVTAPGETSLREARHLHHTLVAHHIDVAGFVVNRVMQLPAHLQPPPAALEMAAQLVAQGIDPDQAAGLVQPLQHAVQRLLHLGQADAGHLKELQRLAGPHGLCVAVPQQEGDVHHLPLLCGIGRRVLASA